MAQFGIRGKRVTVTVALGGQRYEQTGLSNVTVTERRSIDTFSPAGSPIESTDRNHKGFEVSWEARKSNGVTDVMLDRILARLAAGLTREELTVTVTESYPTSAGAQSVTYSYFEGDLEVDSMSFGSGDDPVVAKFKATVEKRRRTA